MSPPVRRDIPGIVSMTRWSAPAPSPRAAHSRCARLMRPVPGTATGSPIIPLEDAAFSSSQVINAAVEPLEADAASENGRRTLKDVEREVIQHTLGIVGGNRKKAAEILDIGVRTLYRKLGEYDLR